LGAERRATGDGRGAGVCLEKICGVVEKRIGRGVLAAAVETYLRLRGHLEAAMFWLALGAPELNATNAPLLRLVHGVCKPPLAESGQSEAGNPC
jgi:hypothetical protein